MISRDDDAPVSPEGRGSDSQPGYWTNRSVVKFARGRDPLDTIILAARDIVLDAIEAGWSGPPFDPVQLADRLRIPVIPRDDVPDARLIRSSSGEVCIEFNPNQVPARARFSVAHELAHTLFPDHAERVRMRGPSKQDDWQLELLCNMAAAEILMPVGMGVRIEDEPIDMENLILLRKRFGVSTEAMLLRMVKLTKEPCAAFAAARVSPEDQPPSFRIDYFVPSRSWATSLPKGYRVRRSSSLAECTAVGFTSKATETWSAPLSGVEVECIGVPAYPGDIFPRIVGVLHPAQGKTAPALRLVEIRGDATDPRGTGNKIIAQVVNDKTPNWGAGFARAIRTKWPAVQADFVKWASERRGNLALGRVRPMQVSDELTIFSMIAQRGYGSSALPRIRYSALVSCLEQCAALARERNASVHMPRIGTGHAGGDWGIVRELVDGALAGRGIAVTIYSLPDAEPPKMIQRVLTGQTEGASRQ